MIKFDRHIQIGLSSFLAATTLGLLLRFSAVQPIDFIFRYVVHAHSHVALIGWVYIALITIIAKEFFAANIPLKVYRRIFAITLISIVGMLASFPFQGYALFSIIFSTLFLFASYFYTWAFFKYTPKALKNSTSYKVTKYAILYMVLSSVGPWGIGAVMGTLGPTSPLYHSSIYFYLHFQYNAWMILAIIGILVKIFENNNIQIDQDFFKKFLKTFNFSIIVTYLISILFLEPPRFIYLFAIIGSFIQIASFIYLYHAIKDAFIAAATVISRFVQSILIWGYILCFIKLIMQLTGSFPTVADLIVKNTYLTIGFIHWVFLGVASLSILGLLKHYNFIRLSFIQIRWFALGFILTEFLIFYKPFSFLFGFLPTIPIQAYNLSLFLVSALLVGAIASILFSQFRKETYYAPEQIQIRKKYFYQFIIISGAVYLGISLYHWQNKEVPQAHRLRNELTSKSADKVVEEHHDYYQTLSHLYHSLEIGELQIKEVKKVLILPQFINISNIDLENATQKQVEKIQTYNRKCEYLKQIQKNLEYSNQQLREIFFRAVDLGDDSVESLTIQNPQDLVLLKNLIKYNIDISSKYQTLLKEIKNIKLN